MFGFVVGLDSRELLGRVAEPALGQDVSQWESCDCGDGEDEERPQSALRVWESSVVISEQKED